MKSPAIAVVALVLTLTAGPAVAQQPTLPPPDTGRVTAQQLGMVIFPAQGQSPDQQHADENACYDWASQNVGYRITPNTAGQIQAAANEAGAATSQKAEEATAGLGVAGAARGAAAGAIIGGITGDAGEGAAIGAVTGAVAGRRARRQASAQAGQQAAASVQQQGAEAINNFKRAMGACLEGKHYTVR